MPLNLFFKKKKKEIVFKDHPKPKIRSKSLPGPESIKLAESLKRYECPQITYHGGIYPLFLKKAYSAMAEDVDGNRFLDLTGFFGVDSIGHVPRSVADAVLDQSRTMTHGLGDVHPNYLKVELGRKLAELTPGNLSQSIFSCTGSEAVESALKAAMMSTKKPGVIAFEGAYHGLGYGALGVTHRTHFREPFEKQLGKHVAFAPYPDVRLYGSKATETTLVAMKKIITKMKRTYPIGAVIIEPIQGRAGIMVPPQNFLKELRAFCDSEKLLLIFDEVYTGFGRTGFWFASQKYDVVPDLMCLGKAMGGGLPISACIGSARVMHAFGSSTGEAIHTSTFLGWPLGCAAALAGIADMEERKLVERSKVLGEYLRKELYKLKEKYAIISEIRGSGLLIGMDLREPLGTLFAAPLKNSRKKKKPALPSAATSKAKLFVEECAKAGILVLCSGAEGNVITLTPPFVITQKDLEYVLRVFDQVFKKIN